MFQIIAPPLPTLLDAGEDTYIKGQSHPNRTNIGVFDLLIVTKGCLFMGEEEGKFQVDAENALILFPDRHHYSFMPCNQDTHFYWFHFSVTKGWKELNETSNPISFAKENKQSRNPFSEKPFGIVLPNFCKIHNWKAVADLCKQLFHYENESSHTVDWQQQIMFQQLLQQLSNQANLLKSHPSLAVAEQAVAFIRKNYQRKINYQVLAESLRFHPNHIARCMISSLGITPIEYVNQVRLDHAKVLLVSKDWSIEKIAENCGYSQAAYFSRLFKREEGISPNEFRKKYMGPSN
jgi:AraC-like DNA-binding protein